MAEETKTEEFTAAAPPHPGAAGTGETSFGDAEAPPAAAPRGPEGDQRSASSEDDKAAAYLQLAKELLPALDHLEIALKAAEAHAPSEPGAGGHEDVVKGFAMVRDELVTALGRAGIEAFSPRGEAFDPSQHEAMAQHPVEGAESGTVVEVYQTGYRIDGTVLRPARVVVAQ